MLRADRRLLLVYVVKYFLLSNSYVSSWVVSHRLVKELFLRYMKGSIVLAGHHSEVILPFFGVGQVLSL